MRRSKAAALFVALLGGALFLGMPDAKAWPSKGAVKGWCDKVGGVYFPPSRRGAYACVAPNGDFIVCGGYIGPNSHYCDGSHARFASARFARKQFRRTLESRDLD